MSTVNGYARRGELYVPTVDLERGVRAEPAPAAGGTFVPPDPEPAPAPVDGNTERVQEHKARVAEADRIRALPTERVLARRQQLAEAEQLARLDTTDHARRLYVAGERQRAELAAKAGAAAGKRRLEADTDVRALKLGTLRRSRTSILWAVLGAAMAYTAVNVQRFAAGSSLPWSAQWVVAWLVDPLLSGLVVALLLTRGDLAVFGKPSHESWWDRIVVHLVEIGALLAALLMNVAPEIQARSPWEAIALHVVIPLAAVAAALALPVVQRRYSAGIAALYAPAVNVTDAGQGSATTLTPDTSEPAFVGSLDTVHDNVHEGVYETAPEPVHGRPSRTPRRRSRKASTKRTERPQLADYVNTARGHLAPDVVVTASWVRSKTGCARGTAYRVVDVLKGIAPDVTEEVTA